MASSAIGERLLGHTGEISSLLRVRRRCPNSRRAWIWPSVDSGRLVPKVNLTYKIDADTWCMPRTPRASARVASTASTPPNRLPYQPDYLTNYEVGWKTSGWTTICVATAHSSMRIGRTSSSPSSARTASPSSECRRCPHQGRRAAAGVGTDTGTEPAPLGHGTRSEDERELLLRRRLRVVSRCRPRPVPRSMRCRMARSCQSCPSSRVMRRHATPSRSGARTCRDMGRRPTATRVPRTRNSRRAQNAVIGSVPAYGLLDLSVGIDRGTFNAELFAGTRRTSAHRPIVFRSVRFPCAAKSPWRPS